MTHVVFTVHGSPAPQGSKVAIGNGGMRESSKHVGPWRNAVSAAAAETMGALAPLVGPVVLDVVFVFARPASHFGTGRNAGKLKPTAPIVVERQPDVDKLVRAVGDALSGIVFHDDKSVVELRARKHYGSPCAHIEVAQLSPLTGGVL